MDHRAFAVTPALAADIPAVIQLIMAQEDRQLAQGSRLHTVHSHAQVKMEVARQQAAPHTPLVVRDEHDQVRAYAAPSLWTLDEASILLAFLTMRNGIVQNLTLPDPEFQDALAIARVLLAALDAAWRTIDTTGDLIRWPSRDVWLEPILAEQGFLLDSICALRSLQPFFTPRIPLPPGLSIRPARPADEAELVELFQDELAFHEDYTPFVHKSPQVVQAFRKQLAQMWAGLSMQDGAPFVLVIEQEGRAVAMAENTLLTVDAGDEPGFTPPGRYWCIDNMSVQPDLQGRGVGRLLVQAIADSVPALLPDAQGYVLWFNPANPKASRFWQHLGFQPLWTTFQRLHSAKIA